MLFCNPSNNDRKNRFNFDFSPNPKNLGKDSVSIFDFLKSNALKALLGKRPEFLPFTVENSQKPIIGIPPEIAHEYWMEQVAKGNTKARTAFGGSASVAALCASAIALVLANPTNQKERCSRVLVFYGDWAERTWRRQSPSCPKSKPPSIS
jgi:hypothetical protein